MGFLSNLVRNRALIGNLSREPMAQRIDPISTNPFGNFPIMPLPVAPRPVDDPIGPGPVPRPIPAPVLPPVFDESIFASPISPAPISIMGQPLSGADLELARSSGRGGLKGAFDNFQKFIAQNPDKTRQGGGILGGADLTGESLRRAYDEERGVLQRPPITPPVSIGGPTLDTSLIPTRAPIPDPRLIDFGFGPGIRPTEIIGPDGRIIGPAGVTPPDFRRNIAELPPERIAEIGNPIPVNKIVEDQVVTTPPVTTPPPLVEPVIQEPIVPPVSVDPIQPVVSDPVVTPTATTVNTPVTTIPQDVRGQVDPVLAQQDAREIQTDPLLRALYFGTADQPGYLNQLQQATANLIGSDVPLQQTAGLSELEQMAQDRAIADLGVAEPFVGERADLLRGTTRQFDPSMTQQFFNPYEDRVVQQTIQDVLEAGEKRDIAQRAQDIQSGGLSAFGSRARLTAADRQEALGRGLAEALGGIRQAGFTEAQRSTLSTFDRQRLAEQQAATGIGQVGTQLSDLRASERAGLTGFGQTGRDIEETGLARLFQQQVDAQGRPLQALQVTGQLLPQFQAGSTQIDSQYRLPVDPSAAGLGAAFSAYSALAPKQGTA